MTNFTTAAREQIEEMEEREERRRRRRERHERHKRERERAERERLSSHRDDDYDHRRQKKEKDSHSESDSTPDDEPPQKLTESQKPRKIAFDQPAPAVPAAPVVLKPAVESTLREDPERPGTYIGYIRNPPRR